MWKKTWKKSTTTAFIIAAIFSLAACSVHDGKGMVTGTVTPASLIDAQIAPQVIPLGLTAGSLCPTFTTPFDLIVLPVPESRAFLSSVTVRLTDGSSVGGPAVTFPQPILTHIFGSTLVVGPRTFSFAPQFGCSVFVPRMLVADLVITDSNGVERLMTTTATVK